MIGFSITAIFLLMPLVIYKAGGGPCGSCASAWFIASIVVAGLFAVGNIIAQLCAMYNQIEDIEKIEERKSDKRIYEAQRDDLVEQATLYLGNKYPEHEKEIFKMITEKGNDALVNVLMTLPDLKSAETLKSLVSTIKKLHSDVYSQDIAINKLKRKIRVRKRNPWLVRAIIPTYTEEVQP